MSQEIKKSNQEINKKKIISSIVINPNIKSRSSRCSCSGESKYYEIQYKYDDVSKGMIPYRDKPLDRYKMIQASKAKVDITDIIKRAQCGDVSVVNMKQVLDLDDVSQLPDNINDAHNLSVNALSQWSSVSPEVRNLFSNDLEKFMTAVDDGSYVKVINDYFTNKSKDKDNTQGDGE